ncbi:hypothetical protein U2P60_07115 [Brucella sp. H1_1004]|uniref:hypothetical protein n=1 Tax=Brucella sp. H1_1004 TaxID=3110109 RepID=UPI0039B69E74
MPTEIVAAIAAIPDVVEHGLFLNGIDTIVIARGDTMEVLDAGSVGLADLHLRGLDDSAATRSDLGATYGDF